MSEIIKVLLIFTIIILSGCSSKSLEPNIEFQPPEYVQELPSKETEDVNNLGSIFGQGKNPLFADRKAMKINDIVAITITESTSSSSSGTKSLSDSNANTLGGGTLTYGGGGKDLKQATKELNNALNLSLSSKSSSKFSGKGSSDRTEKFKTEISARIVKVLNNGNYYISGRRELLINGEKQIMQISGVIRPFDIDQNNKISSSKIADAKILYETEGDISDTTKKGWLSQFISKIWPF